jgi:hypothetical protein
MERLCTGWFWISKCWFLGGRRGGEMRRASRECGMRRSLLLSLLCLYVCAGDLSDCDAPTLPLPPRRAVPGFKGVDSGLRKAFGPIFFFFFKPDLLLSIFLAVFLW